MCFSGSDQYQELQKEEVPMKLMDPNDEWEGFDETWDEEDTEAPPVRPELQETSDVGTLSTLPTSAEAAEVPVLDPPITTSPASSMHASTDDYMDSTATVGHVTVPIAPIRAKPKTKPKPKPASPPTEPENDYFSAMGMAPAIKASEVTVTRIKRAPAVASGPVSVPKVVVSTPLVPPVVPPVTDPVPAPEPVAHSSRFDMDEDMTLGSSLSLDLGMDDLDDAMMGLDMNLGGLLSDEEPLDTSAGAPDLQTGTAPLTTGFADGMEDLLDGYELEDQVVVVPKTKKDRKKRRGKKKGLGVVAL